jgi:hypothetical protein
MAKISKKAIDNTTGDEYVFFYCPACKDAHMVRIAGPCSNWGFNGDKENPTFIPSVRLSASPTKPMCHSVITNGMIAFQSDSGHELAGQTIPLPEYPEYLEETD